jgi:opacity protein-like surface antigen
VPGTLARRISRPDARPAPLKEEGIMRILIALMATATLMVAPAAARADSGPYFGAGVGNFALEVGPFDGSDVGYKVLGGYRFNPYIAAELEYFDGGSPDDFGVEIDVSGFNLSALGAWPVNEQLDLFAKLGMVSWDAETAGFDDDGEDLSYGIGLGYGFTENIVVRVEYQRFDIEDTDAADLFSGSLVWRF